MNENKYCVFFINGGLGKNVMATAICEAITKKYPDRKLLVVSSWPMVFYNNPNVYRIFKTGFMNYFYNDYVKDKDTIFFNQEPYNDTNHIYKREHLIKTWCNIFDLEYNGELPKIYLNAAELEKMKRKIQVSEKPILLLQTNGGTAKEENDFSWARDMPYDLAVEICRKNVSDYNIIQVALPNHMSINGIQKYSSNDDREYFCLVALSSKLIGIDSSLQHIAAALNKSATVFWVTTSPTCYGYSIHNNILPEKEKSFQHLYISQFVEYDIGGNTLECPYNSFNDLYDLDEVNKYC